jgi:hypothetical protein
MDTGASSPAVSPVRTGSFPLTPQFPRLTSVDVLRGLAMVIMALDHTRDFMSNSSFHPEDLAHTNPALFFTRFITHFVAPVFCFLAGTGAFLAMARGKSLKQVSWFFFTRGLWLVVLELTIVDFAWGFVPWAFAGVIWVLGWSMVLMAVIVRLPVGWIAVGTRHDSYARIAGSGESSFAGKVVLALEVAPHTRSHRDHFAFFVPGDIYADSMGWRNGSRFCVREVVAPIGSSQMDSGNRNLRDNVVLLDSRVEPLRKWSRRAAVWIPALNRTVEPATHGFVNRDLVFQHPEVSALARLSVDDTRAFAHPACFA